MCSYPKCTDAEQGLEVIKILDGRATVRLWSGRFQFWHSFLANSILSLIQVGLCPNLLEWQTFLDWAIMSRNTNDLTHQINIWGGFF